MVSALFLIVVGLGGAFALGLLRESQVRVAYLVTTLVLAVMAVIAVSWTVALAIGAATSVDITTAGTPPPFAINLRIGLVEAALLSVITIVGFLSALAMRDALIERGQRAMAVLLVLIMALSGLVMTRDVFNLFVFVELIVIASAGLVLLSADGRAIAAGFKYLIVAQVISVLLLIGIIFTYHANGSLNIDDIAAQPMAFQGASLALFLVLIALLLELKPFPANGWALDIYELAHPGFSALFSAASGTAALFAADKLFAAAGPAWLPLATGVGLLTFLGANVLALSQQNDRRLLGYSSVGQIGLVLAIIGQRDILGDNYLFVAGGILVTHAVAKAGLFWLSDFVRGRTLTDWAALRAQPVLIFAFVSFIAMLVGLPPFPGFYAKWSLAHALVSADRLPVLALILGGALIEAGYMFRWFGYALKREAGAPPDVALFKIVPALAALVAGWALGFVWGALSGNLNLLTAIPVLFALAFLPLDVLPARIKNVIAIAGLVAWFAFRAPTYDPFHVLFAVIMLLGGAIIFLASFNEGGRRVGFYPSAMLMYAGLALLLEAQTSFTFFAAWEVLTVGSYFLILRGKLSEPHALSYILFSLGGAFALLAGFAMAAGGVQPFALDGLKAVPAAVAPFVFILLALGFMTKTASIGLHIWLPGAHAEAETDVSPMVSGILLKAGLFGLWLLLTHMGHQRLYGYDLTHALVWIGALSAFIGAVLAAFQEDAKRLLAYSSISQLGYAVFGLGLMTHLGWILALLFVVNHYLYKSMLFLSVGGVYKRTHTKLMYKMGGLITLMPITFVAVLVGIIAMSGVPPLSGFGGRWLFYQAILDGGQKLPLILIFMTGPIAFLYLFRLIHTIFLGQLHDEHRKLKEAPFWLLVPQVVYVAALIGFAVLPGMVLHRVNGYLDTFFNDQPLVWTGRVVTSAYGVWNPVAVMLVTIGLFVTVLAFLVAMNHNAQWVKQFNIVFSGERPFKPQTTHFAWNFFAPYRKAMGFVEAPIVTSFWNGVTDSLAGTAEFGRRLYTGNGQTYAVQVLFFVIAVYLIAMGGVK